jgi:hypothetical protein
LSGATSPARALLPSPSGGPPTVFVAESGNIRTHLTALAGKNRPKSFNDTLESCCMMLALLGGIDAARDYLNQEVFAVENGSVQSTTT